jgi:RecB family exonuclease
LTSPLAPEEVTLSTPWRAPVPRAVAALVDRRLRRAAPISSDSDTATDADSDASRWSVGVYDGPAEMAAHIAARVRDLHVVQGLLWSTLAVLTRTPGDLQMLRRELEAAGVPTIVEVDDAPLARESAVAALLDIVRAALDPASVDPARARDIVAGPLVGLDPFEVRQLARDARAHWPRVDPTVPAGTHPGGAVPSGDEVLRSILIDPTPGVTLPGEPAWDRVRRVHALLTEIQRQVDSGAAPMQVLWTAWTFDHSRWPERLRSAALAGQRRAAHDLDAVSALFETADRLTERYAGVLGVGGFVEALDAQRLPAERVAGRSSVEGVHLLTVHAAKGREWEHVIVTGAQEGRWPAPERASVLGVDRLGVDRLGAGASAAVVARLHEDRRLMYLALTRARRHTHVAVVSSPTDTGEQPSRFIADLLGGDPTEIAAATAVAPTGVVVQRRAGRPTRAGTLAAWVADLRGVLADPDAPIQDRAEAASALSWLGEQRLADGTAIVPAADPAHWWGLRDPSCPPGSLSAGGDRVRVSVSDVDALLTCPLQWFLRRVVGWGAPPPPNASLGRVVHALADSVAGGEAPNDPQALQTLVDQVWDAIGFDVAWQSRAEREAARAMVERLCAYARGRDHALIASEIGFSVPIDLGEVGTVEVRGRMDRIELDDAGVHIVDLKTGARAPSARQVDEHRQLAVYQLAAEHGALGDVVPADTAVAGASLVHVRIDGQVPGQPRVQVQQAAPEVLDNARADLARAAQLLAAGELVAKPGAACATCDVRRLCPNPGPSR